MAMGTLVTIVSLQKEQGARSLTYYAIQRVSDGRYLQTDEKTWLTGLYGQDTLHLNRYDTAILLIERLLLGLCKHLNERLSPGPRRVYCTDCNAFVAWVGERVVRDLPNVTRIYVDGKPIQVSTKTGKPYPLTVR